MSAAVADQDLPQNSLLAEATITLGEGVFLQLGGIPWKPFWCCCDRSVCSLLCRQDRFQKKQSSLLRTVLECTEPQFPWEHPPSLEVRLWDLCRTIRVPFILIDASEEVLSHPAEGHPRLTDLVVASLNSLQLCASSSSSEVALVAPVGASEALRVVGGTVALHHTGQPAFSPWPLPGVVRVGVS